MLVWEIDVVRDVPVLFKGQFDHFKDQFRCFFNNCWIRKRDSWATEFDKDGSNIVKHRNIDA